MIGAFDQHGYPQSNSTTLVLYEVLGFTEGSIAAGFQISMFDFMKTSVQASRHSAHQLRFSRYYSGMDGLGGVLATSRLQPKRDIAPQSTGNSNLPSISLT